MAKAKEDFKNIEPELMKQFKELMEDPYNAKWNLEEKDAQYIENLSALTKRAGLKMLIKNAKAQFLKQDTEELAQTVQNDMEEDGAKLTNEEDLQDVLKHPENEKWHLEEAMVKHIKSLTNKELGALKSELAKHYDIQVQEGFKEHLLKFFKDLWAKLEPIFSVVIHIFANFGGDLASKAIIKKGGDNLVTNALAEQTKDAINSTAETIVDSLAKTHKAKALEEEDNKDKEEDEDENEELAEVANPSKEENKDNLLLQVEDNEEKQEEAIEVAGNVVDNNSN